MTETEIDGSRLLIVDDDALMRSMASRTLSHAGFSVSEADGGAPALALFGQARFDLVLLDVMMPDMDGYQVCRHVRALPHGERIPIIMLTGLNDTQSIELAYQAGATDFITKPINWTLLTHRIRYALRASLAAESAIRSRDRLERAQRIANMGSWEIAGETNSFVCSPELARLFGAPVEVMGCASPQAFLDRVSDTDRATVKAMREAAEREGVPYQLTFKVTRFDGTVRTVHEQASPLRDSAGRQIAVEGITQDITDQVETEKRISRLARYDTLTGLPNREFFVKLAAKSLERSLSVNSTCALVYLDVDRFKSVNDAIGQQKANGVLVKLAERLTASARAFESQFAGRMASESVLARVGPNTFALLLTDIGDEQRAGAVTDQLLQSVSMPFTSDGSELVLTASAGIALFPRDSGNNLDLARCAEQALHAAKAQGRAQRRFFNETMNESASQRLAQESELRRAIADGQLRVHYQAKVDARNGKMAGAEALVRWQHPTRGLVSPAQFIALAEESGQILALTECVLETVCSDLARWRDAGQAVVPVSVNLASPSFSSDALPGQLTDLVQRHGLTSAALVLEVTESILMADVERVVMRLEALRTLGFSMSLDDFGTGYSSLSYLKRFPIDELKIDRTFVTDAWRGGRDGAIAASIIALGREFGLRVVAEGVETREQADHLIKMGCIYQQGFLFARPMAADDFARLLDKSPLSLDIADGTTVH
jgi:diguanylate cyclase (GGDEF)-like protein/PAS domain S-box-containing protein